MNASANACDEPESSGAFCISGMLPGSVRLDMSTSVDCVDAATPDSPAHATRDASTCTLAAEALAPTSTVNASPVFATEGAPAASSVEPPLALHADAAIANDAGRTKKR